MGWAAEAAANLYHQDVSEDGALSENLRKILEKAAKSGEKEGLLRQLAEELLRSATFMSRPDKKLFKCFEIITSTAQFGGDQLKCHDVLHIVSEFDSFHRFGSLAEILKFLREYLPGINSSSFDSQDDCSNFVTNVLAIFKWFFSAFQNVMKNEQMDEMAAIKIGMDIIATANTFLDEPFVMKVLQLVAQKKILGGVGNTFQGMRALAKLARSPPLSKEFERFQENIEKIHSEMEKMPYHYFNTIGALQKRPGIRSLTAIFMAYRVLCPAGEIAETIELVGTINNYGRTQVAVDILHACLLIMLEEFPSPAAADLTKTDDVERVPLDIYKFNLCNIFFKKFPQIFEILVQRGYMQWNDILFAVDHLIRTFKQELDQLDYAIRANSIRLFMETFGESGKMPKDMIERAIQLRVEQIRTNSELNGFIIRSASEEKSVPIAAFQGKKSHGMISSRSVTAVDPLMRTLVRSDTILLEGMCSWYCVEGDILDLTRRLASLGYGAEKEFAEKGANSPESLETFGIYFMILSRLSWYFPSLSLEDLVTGSTGTDSQNLESGFYKWTKAHVKRIVPKEETEPAAEASNTSMQEPAVPDVPEQKPETEFATMQDPGAELPMDMAAEVGGKDEPMDTEEGGTPTGYSEETKEKCLNLAHRQVFWDWNGLSPLALLELVPVIGEVWLNEYKTRTIESDAVKELFACFKELPVMTLCLSQWLENQPYSPQRFLMGKYLLDVVNDWQINFAKRTAPRATQETLMWQFLWMQCRLHLSEISENPPFFHPMSVFQKSVANRTLPKCGRYEVPQANMMKDMWIYCQRQNWFSVKPLVLIDHLNKSNNPRSWITGLAYSTIKLETQDTVAKCVEMLTTIILLDPVRAAAKAIEVLTDLLLMRDPTKNPDKPTIMQVPECTMPIVQAAIQSLIIGVWLVNRRSDTNEPPETKRRRSSIDVEQPWKSLMTEDTDELDVLNAFITNAINCLVSEALCGVMRPASSVIYHFLNFIARSERNKFRDMLIRRIPQQMIFRLAVVDPHSLPLEVFSEFCEQDQQAHNESQLQYLFLLRKCGGI